RSRCSTTWASTCRWPSATPSAPTSPSGCARWSPRAPSGARAAAACTSTEMRVYRIPYSTNVERVALALAHKSIAVEWVDVDPADRSPVVELSGQDLVPVMVTDHGEVIIDSMRIV